MTDAGPAVELRQVTVTSPRRDRPLLDHVTLRVDPGEAVLVLGASGSGKSTLLAVVVGTVPHAVALDLTGTVALAGTDVTADGVVARSRTVGRVGQDPAAGVCLPTVEQDLAALCENHGVEAALVDGRIGEALAAVGAQALRHRTAGTLSGGELQRVSLAAAITVPPPVLVLDEPTSMLDAAGVTAVWSAVDAVRSRYRPAVVVVEHRLDDWTGPDGSRPLPPRTVVVDDGRIVLDGPTDTVLTEHVARLHDAGCRLPLRAELIAVRGDADAPLTDRAGPPLPSSGGTEIVLRARGLTVGRAGRPVVSGVDLDLHAGGITAVLGANGCGKSTLLLTLAGLLPPLAGTVRSGRAGMVFQNPEHGFVGRTVTADLASGLDPRTAAATVGAALDRHRLAHLAAQNPFRLSGGEQRRLSLAAMLAHRRPVLVADEPTYGLDRRDARAAAAALLAAATDGAAVLLSTHDLRLVAMLADRVVVLGDGIVLADGPALAVLRDPRCTGPAGLRLPALLTRLFVETPDDDAVRSVLRSLDAAAAVVPR